MDQRLKSRLRRKLFVSREIQGKLLRRLAVYWFVYHFVLWHTMFLYRYLEYRGWLLAGAMPLTFRELYTTFAIQHYSVVICALAIFPVVLWDMLKMTHRVAGPLVRMRNELKRLARGERVAPIQLRHEDLLTEFVTAYNEFVTSREAEPAHASTPDETTGDSALEAPVSETTDESGVLENVHDLQTTVTEGTSSTEPQQRATQSATNSNPDQVDPLPQAGSDTP